MSRKGYNQEYYAKLELQKSYGKHNVIRTTCSQNVPDFIVLRTNIGEVLGFEVKSTVGEKWYPEQRDREQWKAIKIWSVATGVIVRYWLIYRRKPKNIIEEYTLDEFHSKFMEKE